VKAARIVGILAVMRRPLRSVAARGVGVVRREHRDRRPERGHGVLVGGGQLAHRFEHVLVDRPLGDHRVGEAVETVGVWQLAVPQQVDDLLVARVSRQVLDRVAAVDESPLVAVDLAEIGLGDEHTLEAFP
jgi:hypothetical protein